MNLSPTGAYYVDLPVFSGPLELLLHLIDQKELDITSISLVAVTDQYLAQIETLKESKIENLLDFLAIGANLLLIKSRALLPRPEVPQLGGEEDDPAEILAQQLRNYKKFKDSALWLDDRRTAGMRSYLRIAPPPQFESLIDLTGVSLDTLVLALKEALFRTDQLEDSLSVVTAVGQMTLEGQINKLKEKIEDFGQLLFSDLLSDNVTMQEISVTLLAVLEMIKQHKIFVVQPVIFGPIEILPIQASSAAQGTTTSR